MGLFSQSEEIHSYWLFRQKQSVDFFQKKSQPLTSAGGRTG